MVLGSKVAIFIDPEKEMLEYIKEIGADRVELYTGTYALEYLKNREESIKDYIKVSNYANEIGIGVNAGHDLDLNNLKYLKESIPFIYEVSIGHVQLMFCPGNELFPFWFVCFTGAPHVKLHLEQCRAV